MHLADYIFYLYHVVCYIQNLLLNVFSYLKLFLTDIVHESLERVCHKSMTHPLLVFIRIISNVLLVYPSKQGHQIGVPVDGNLV